MKYIQKICLVLTLIGAFNWGLIGLFDFNLVTWITRGLNVFSRIIYVLIAICAVINSLLLFTPLSTKKEVYYCRIRKTINTI